MVAGGVPLVFRLANRALHADFGSDLLAGISIVAAVVLDEQLTAAFIV